MPSMQALAGVTGKGRSIHRAAWPTTADLPVSPRNGASFAMATTVLSEIRKAKAQAQKGVGAPIAHLEVTANGAALELLEPVIADVVSAAKAGRYELIANEGTAEPVVRVVVEE